MHILKLKLDNVIYQLDLNKAGKNRKNRVNGIRNLLTIYSYISTN